MEFLGCNFGTIDKRNGNTYRDAPGIFPGPCFTASARGEQTSAIEAV